ncbi:Uncharacterized protein At4g14450, chloroplastic [Linum perenne]
MYLTSLVLVCKIVNILNQVTNGINFFKLFVFYLKCILNPTQFNPLQILPHPSTSSPSPIRLRRCHHVNTPATLRSPPPLPPLPASRAIFNGGDQRPCNPSSLFWNVAIPLLSPVETSPTSIERKQQQNQILNQQRGGEADKPIVFKKWQHPAAPFCYEPEKLKPSFFVHV